MVRSDGCGGHHRYASEWACAQMLPSAATTTARQLHSVCGRASETVAALTVIYYYYQTEAKDVCGWRGTERRGRQMKLVLWPIAQSALPQFSLCVCLCVCQTLKLYNFSIFINVTSLRELTQTVKFNAIDHFAKYHLLIIDVKQDLANMCSILKFFSFIFC